MPSSPPPLSPSIRVPLAGLLTWLLPGAGHLFIGERTRGIILMATIAVTFWTGVAIGGVRNTVNPDQRWLWFMGQICAGGHTLAALAISQAVPTPPPGLEATRIAYGREEEISVVYTAICGMLNILIIFDVLVRAEKTPVPAFSRSAQAARKAGGP